jgi:hypothetical protein
MHRSSLMSWRARFIVCPAGLLTALTVAAQVTPEPAGLAATLRDQQQQLQRQREELDRQRRALDAQQRQLEALAAALEQQMRQNSASTEGVAGSTSSKANASTTGGRGLRWSGYADFNVQRLDVYENVQATAPVRRGRADLARFVLAPHVDLGGGWAMAAEIEFEHGGTGATIEYEPEEAGEYEAEIEKGGEIVLEQLWLERSFGPALKLRVGEIVVPFGMVNTHHQPSEYFTIGRSLAEASLIPSVWHETGVQLAGTHGPFRWHLQAVTALDSTGFSGYEFVRGGQQGRLETKNASAFAFVAQGDWAPGPGMLLGGAFYSGDSAPNRPRDNLAGRARVTLAELHGRYEVGPLTLRGQWMTGRLDNADAVTAANFATFNGGELGVSRTAVGSRAQAAWLEGGYDLFSLWPLAGGRLDLFARAETYDTHAGMTGNLVRVARYDRRAVTLGVNWKPQPGIVFKGEFSRRRHAGDTGNTQDQLGVAAGVEF